MTSPRVVDIKGIVDADTGDLLSLALAGIPGDTIPLTGLSAVTTVAGVSPDVSKDIPTASLVAALTVVQQVAGVSPTAGVIAAAALRAALGLPFTVAGVAASGWAGDVTLASLVTAMQAAMNAAIIADQDSTVAGLATPGSFDGQIKRITDAGGNRKPEVVWNSTLSRYYPRNGKSLMNCRAPATFAAAVNMLITLDPITFKANLFNVDLGFSCDMLAGIGGAPTAVTHKISLGATADIVNWTGTTTRELARRVGFRNMGAQNSQRWTVKDTANEYDAPGAYTGNRTTSAEATNVDKTLTNLLQFTNTSQAGAIEYCNYYLTSGGL